MQGDNLTQWIYCNCKTNLSSFKKKTINNGDGYGIILYLISKTYAFTIVFSKVDGSAFLSSR